MLEALAGSAGQRPPVWVVEESGRGPKRGGAPRHPVSRRGPRISNGSESG